MTVLGVFDWLGTDNNRDRLLDAFLINLEIAIVAMILSLVFGLALALLRLARNPWVSRTTGVWIDVWRNVPLILLLLFLSLWMPKEVRDAWVDFVPGWAPEAYQSQFVLAGFTGLTLYNSAVLAEIMRAGIQSLPRGQREAAAALGMTYRQQMRFVILPQGLRRMVPATVGQLITLNKDTTLVSIITIQEVMREGRQITASGGNPFTGSTTEAPILEVFIVIGIMFVVVNLALSILSRRLELRTERKTAGGRFRRSVGTQAA